MLNKLKKSRKGFQWLSLFGAIAVGVQQAVDAGAVPATYAVYALLITNFLSAILPGLWGGKKTQ